MAVTSTVPWQKSHFVEEMWGAEGGSPWHEPHLLSLPLVSFHDGIAAVTPSRLAPWQYTFLHAPFANVAGALRATASPENVTVGAPPIGWPVPGPNAVGTV